jgi:plasmid stability protein
MPTINVRGVPEETFKQFRQLAREDGHSMNAEALAIFEEGVRQRTIRRRREKALQLADQYRTRVGVDTLTLLHEGREER